MYIWKNNFVPSKNKEASVLCYEIMSPLKRCRYVPEGLPHLHHSTLHPRMTKAYFHIQRTWICKYKWTCIEYVLPFALRLLFVQKAMMITFVMHKHNQQHNSLDVICWTALMLYWKVFTGKMLQVTRNLLYVQWKYIFLTFNSGPFTSWQK